MGQLGPLKMQPKLHPQKTYLQNDGKRKFYLLYLVFQTVVDKIPNSWEPLFYDELN